MKEINSVDLFPCTFERNDQAIEVRSPAEAKGFFLQPLCPDLFWVPPSLLYSGY
jgi:hypothetical protein